MVVDASARVVPGVARDCGIGDGDGATGGVEDAATYACSIA